jgi:hypothetical protein
MRCHDCPDLGETGVRKRAVCCMRSGKLVGHGARLLIADKAGTFQDVAAVADLRDDNAARSAAALRDVCPPGTPLNNRLDRRRAAALYGRKAGL